MPQPGTITSLARPTALKPPPAHPFYSKFKITLALHPRRATPSNWSPPEERAVSVELLGLCSGPCPLLCLNMGSLTHFSRLRCIARQQAASTLALYGGRLTVFKDRLRIATATSGPRRLR